MNANSYLHIHGINASVLPASQLLYYELESLDEHTLVVIVSQSGRSGEITSLVENMNAGTDVVALTNDEQSPLGQRASVILNLHVSPEVSVSTRTYLAPLMLMHLFAKCRTGEYSSAVVADIKKSIDYLEASIDDFLALSGRMEAFLGMPPCITLIGRGYSLCTVDAGTLFTKEVAKFPSIPYDAGQFRHGPFEMVGPQFNAMIFAPSGTCFENQLRLAKDVAAVGSKVVFVTDADVQSSERILVVRQQYVSQELAGLVNIVPVQCFSNYIAKQKGLVVGKFLYGSKITTTL
jgi:glucosamine--fructose-6-phosphate aminotransferase (isomerizing)